ncbi:MAG: hypothetical protein H6638_12620 [Ardenticatenales bacterium]|nr:hypothetical protein [Ardenticatenales bacterium]
MFINVIAALPCISPPGGYRADRAIGAGMLGGKEHRRAPTGEHQKRMLACSNIAHAGYMMIILSSASPGEVAN